MIPVEAVEAAHKAWREQASLDGSIFEYNLRSALEAAAPHMLAQKALDLVLDISNVRMNSEHGGPAFVLGWEAALEEMRARINEVMGGDGE